MSLILDDREDPNLARLMTQYDVPVTVARLEYGDACWEGQGPRGPLLIGLERKKLADVVTSMTNGRLSGHQMRGMWQCYDYTYLAVEDIWRPGESGQIEVNQGGKWRDFYAHGQGCTYRQVQSFLNTLSIMGGVSVIRSTSMRETAATYAALVHWWSKKWEQHRSHDEIYAPGPEYAHRRGRAVMTTREPGLTEKVAAQLPGVDRKAWDIGKVFGTAREFAEFMAFSGEREWAQIKGIGKDGARLIVEALDQETGEQKAYAKSNGA